MELDWIAGGIVSLVGGVGTFLAMRKSEWLHDEDGRFAPNSAHWTFVVVGFVGGLLAGLLGGVLVGLAVVLALGNVLLGMVLAWGIAGGDGESTAVAGLLAWAIFFACLAAFAQSFTALDEDVTDRSLWFASSPALLMVAAVPLTPAGREEARMGLAVAAWLALPAGLLWLSTAVG